MDASDNRLSLDKCLEAEEVMHAEQESKFQRWRAGFRETEGSLLTKEEALALARGLHVGTFGPGAVHGGRRYQLGDLGPEPRQLGRELVKLGYEDFGLAAQFCRAQRGERWNVPQDTLRCWCRRVTFLRWGNKRLIDRLLQIRQRLLARHSTLVIRIEETTISVRVRPCERGKAGRAGLDTLGVNIGPRLAALGGALEAGNAPRGREQPSLRAPGHIAGDLEQPHRVGDLVDPVDFFFHQADTFRGLAGENRHPLVVAGYWQVVTQFAARRIKAKARLLMSASWRASPPSPRSRASISNRRQAATRAVPDCPGSDAIFHKMARTWSGVCSTVAQTSG
jgi:hypothetical protein